MNSIIKQEQQKFKAIDPDIPIGWYLIGCEYLISTFMLSFKQEEEEEEEDRIFQWLFTILQSVIMSLFKPINQCLEPHR